MKPRPGMLVADITQAGGNAKAYRCDVSVQEDVKVAFNQYIPGRARKYPGEQRGTSRTSALLKRTPETDFDKIYCVNVKGMYNCMLVSVGHMKQNNGGVILNMASVAGTSGLADRFAYSTSKGAVVAMTYSVAKDYLAAPRFAVTASRQRESTPPSWMASFIATIPAKSARCLRSWRKSQPIGENGHAGRSRVARPLSLLR